MSLSYRAGFARCVFASAWIFVLSLSVAAEDEAWNQFRGPDHNGTADWANLPLNWDDQTNVTWKTEVPGQGWSSPVVGGKRIYLTAAIAVEGEKDCYDLALLVFDADSGKQIDRVDVIRQSAEETRRIHAKNSHASPTPIVVGDRVYVHFGYQGSACVSESGDVLWLNRELTFPPVHGNGGSPILVDGRLIFSCDGAKTPYVAALDADTGKLVWRCDRPVDARKKFSFCTPTVIDVDGQSQVVAPGSDCVLGIDPADGKILWQIDYQGYSVIPQPIMADGIVYVCTGYDQGGIVAFSPEGSGNLTDKTMVWQMEKGISKTPTPVVYDGKLFLVTDPGVGLCLDAKTGDKIWQERLGGNYSASLLLSQGRIYATNEAGLTIVYAAGDEYQELARNDLKQRTLASMAPFEAGEKDALIIRTESTLYRIDAR